MLFANFWHKHTSLRKLADKDIFTAHIYRSFLRDSLKRAFQKFHHNFDSCGYIFILFGARSSRYVPVISFFKLLWIIGQIIAFKKGYLPFNPLLRGEHLNSQKNLRNLAAGYYKHCCIVLCETYLLKYVGLAHKCDRRTDKQNRMYQLDAR